MEPLKSARPGSNGEGLHKPPQTGKLASYPKVSIGWLGHSGVATRIALNILSQNRGVSIIYNDVPFEGKSIEQLEERAMGLRMQNHTISVIETNVGRRGLGDPTFHRLEYGRMAGLWGAIIHDGSGAWEKVGLGNGVVSAGAHGSLNERLRALIDGHRYGWSTENTEE